jgi:hypothetical protein
MHKARQYLGSILLEAVALLVGVLGDHVFGWKDPLTIALVLVFLGAALLTTPWSTSSERTATKPPGPGRSAFVAGDSKGDEFESIMAVNVDAFIDGRSRKSKYRRIQVWGRKDK